MAEKIIAGHIRTVQPGGGGQLGLPVQGGKALVGALLVDEGQEGLLISGIARCGAGGGRACGRDGNIGQCCGRGGRNSWRDGGAGGRGRQNLGIGVRGGRG